MASCAGRLVPETCCFQRPASTDQEPCCPGKVTCGRRLFPHTETQVDGHPSQVSVRIESYT